jgi:hypothetical protein
MGKAGERGNTQKIHTDVRERGWEGGGREGERDRVKDGDEMKGP